MRIRTSINRGIERLGPTVNGLDNNEGIYLNDGSFLIVGTGIVRPTMHCRNYSAVGA